MRTLMAFGFVAALFLTCSGRGEDKLREPTLPALQDALEEVIAKTEVSVACILVSRSTEYGRFPWKAAPSAPTQGKLGGFDGERFRRIFRQDANQKELDLLNALDLASPSHNPESYGSGIVIDETGLVLTNAHVVRNATKVYVRLPGGRGSYADIHASDPRSDLAVLKLLDPVKDLKAIEFWKGDKLRKGQFVLLVANPFAAGFRDGSPSVSWGMISNLRRRTPGPRAELDRERTTTLHHYGTLLQLDARMNLGSSGGAVLNIKGELIGITTALAALTGTETPGGFAVPFDPGMRRIVEVLKRGEEVNYGFLGVYLDNETGGQKNGVKIAGTMPGSPASKAGLGGNEVLVAINGTPIRENDDLFLLLGIQLAGNTVELDLQTLAGKPRTVKVTLGKYYVPGPIIASQQPPARFGLRVDYTSIISQRLDRPRRPLPEGVAIREVVPGSAADLRKLQVDKIITRVNGKDVKTPAEFYGAMATTGRSVEITLNDEGRDNTIKLESP
jgi:serine protease Do